MKLRKIIILPFSIIVFCFFSFISNAEENFQPIFFEPEIGDTFVLNIHNEKIKFQGNTKLQEIKGITKVVVLVESKDDEYYNVLWKYHETEVQSFYHSNDPVTPLLEEINRGLKVSLKIDDVGTIVDINNKEEIKAYMKDAMNKIMDSLASEGAPPSYIDNLKKQLSLMFTNENSFQQTILKEPSLFYSGYGLDFTKSKIIKYDTYLPNPLSGTPITAKGEYHLSGTPDSYIINWQQKIDPEKAKIFILDFLKKLNHNVSSEQLPAFDIIDSATFKFKENNFILFNHERKTEAIDQKRIDRIHIELENNQKPII